MIQREPLAWKGGLLVPLFKGKGQASQAQSYRAISVSDHLAKMHHSLLRDRLAGQWESQACDTQMGGRRRHGVDMAHHMVQALVAHGHRHQKSVGVLFTDLRAAFYTVIRQALVQHPLDDAGLCRVLAQLGVAPDEVDRLRERARQDNAVGLGGNHDEQVLADMLTGSHFGMTGTDTVVQTHRGTRPGDPVGDVLFNMAMTSAMKDLHRRIKQAGVPCMAPAHTDELLSEEGPRYMVNGCLDVVFFDDLAVMVSADSSESLVSHMKVLGALVDDTMTQRGLQVNHDQGKTEVLLQLRGRKSKILRDQIHNQQQGKLELATQMGPQAIAVTHAYKHLGTWIQESAKPEREKRARAAAAASAYGPLRKTLYKHQHADMRVKKQVFEATVVTRHAYNVHVWSWVAGQDLDRWQADLSAWQAEMAGKAQGGKPCFEVGAKEAAGRLGTLTPRQRLSLARLRYAKRALHIAPPVLWAMLLGSEGDDRAWISHVKEDCEWLVAHAPRRTLPQGGSVRAWLRHILHAQDWGSTLKIAESACARSQANQVGMQDWERRFVDRARDQGVTAPQPQVPQPEMQPQRDTFWCDECGTSSKSRQALAMHATKMHGYKRSNRSWACVWQVFPSAHQIGEALSQQTSM